MFNLRRIASSGSLPHLFFKRETKNMARIVVAPPFSSSSSSAENANNSQITTPTGNKPPSAEIAKSRIFGKLQSLITETLDFITREEEEKKGVVYLNKEELVDWAKRLNQHGKFEYAFEIFEWMDKKKMEFFSSELALFADLIAQTKAHTHAKKCEAEDNKGKVSPSRWWD